MKKILLALGLAAIGTVAAMADDIAYVNDVRYYGDCIQVFVCMNTQSQAKYESVRVKVTPTGSAENKIGKGHYQYATVSGTGTTQVNFTCNGDAADVCGIYDFTVTTVDKVEKK